MDIISHHVGDSKIFWDRYRQFELSNIAKAPDGPEKQDLIEKLRKIFRRELQTPHIGMDVVYEQEYVPWEVNLVGGEKNDYISPFESQYKKALELLEERLEFEKSVQSIEATNPLEPDYTLLPLWKNYIEFESNQPKPSVGRIRCLYERAIKTYFLVPDIWDRYTTFAGTSLKNNQKVVISIHKRAVRNYPYNYLLWCKWMVLSESFRQSSAEIEEIFNKALSSGLQSPNDILQVYRQYLDYHVRKITSWEVDKDEVKEIRELFGQAIDYFVEYFPDHVMEIYKHAISVEQYRIKDIQAAAKIYDELLKKFNKTTSVYVSYATFCTTYDLVKESRSLYKRASGIKLDDPMTLFSHWIEFERVFGSIEDYKYAFDKCQKSQRDLYGSEDSSITAMKDRKSVV